MRYKLILFSLGILISFSLVYAFESPVYEIGMNVPSGEQGNIEVIIIDPGIEFNITNETYDTNYVNNLGGSSGGGGSSRASDDENNRTTEDGSSGVVELTSDEDFGFTEIDEPKSFFSRITGAVTGTLGTTGTTVVVIFLVGLLGSAITIRQIRKRRRLKS